MKQQFAPRKARALAPLLVATALVSTPVFAQETAPQTAPPQAAPVVTPPNSATVPIPPVVRTVPEGSTPTTTEPASQPAPRAARAPARPAPRTATRTTSLRSTSTSTTTTAPVAAPAPAPKPAAPAQPEAAAPQPVQPAPAPVTEPAPAPASGSATSESTTTSSIPLWAWIAGGIAALAVILGAALAMRRRREDYYNYDEDTAYTTEPAPTYVEPEPIAAAPVIAPIAVEKAAPRKEPEYLRRSAPLSTPVEPIVAAPDEVHMESAASDDVAALTGGETVAERPWLEFAMRPVRAGTNVDEALVEIELTVGNAGSVSAKDVRISTFLLSADPNGSEMERLLVNPPADATTDPVTIKPGEGKRIDATLALLKSEMGEVLPDSIRPIVVADARYTLADGTEGRTSASFLVGVTPEEGGPGLEPIELTRSSMHDNVGAELHREPLHA